MNRPDDLGFIKDAHRWNRWPFLPVIRGREVATVIDKEAGKGQFLFLEGQNMWGELDTSKGVLKSAEEIVAEGWRVD